jgi:hypothetical protein
VKEREHVGNLNADGKMIRKGLSERHDVKLGTGFNWLRERPSDRTSANRIMNIWFLTIRTS